MKKIIYSLVALLTGLFSYGQISTVNQQTVTGVKIDTTNARLTSIRAAGYIQATAAAQAIQTTSLGIINTSLATLATTVGVNTTSLSLFKKSNDTIAQNTRAINTGISALTTTMQTSQNSIKKSNDTIAQNTRAIYSVLSGTTSSFSYDKRYKLSSSVSTSTASYESGDNIGGIITLGNGARYTAGDAVLTDLTVWDNENQKPTIVIDFWSASPSGTYTDNAAQVMAGDGGTLLFSVQVSSSDYVTTGAISRATVNANKLRQTLAGSANRNYYITIYTTSTPTYSSANGSRIKTGFKQD